MTKNIIKIVVLAICLLFAGANLSDAKVTTHKTENGTIINVEDTQNKEVDTKKCTPLSQKLDKARKTCMFCPLFKILYTAGSSVSVASFDALAEPFQMVLVIGFALYIAFLTLKQVGAFTKQDGSKYISELLVIGFKVLIVFLLLGNGSQIYRLGLEPLLSAGLDVGASFLSAPSSENSVDITSCGQGSVSGTDKAFYSDSLQEKLDCYLRKVGEETMVGDVVGSALICAATASEGDMPVIKTLASGLLVRLFAWLIYIAFAFYLIDAVVRLGIVGAILPFLIAAWPFKATSGYTKKGWDIYLNAVFIFIFMGLIVSVTVELLSSAVTGGNGDSSEVLGYIANDNIVDLARLFDMGNGSFLFVLLCGIFGFKLSGEASSLAAEMGTSGGTGIASKIGGLGANAAYGVAKKGVKVGAKSAVAVTKGVASVIPTGGGKSLRTRVNNGLDSVSRFAGNVAQKAHDILTPEGRAAARNARNSLPDPNTGGNGGPDDGGNNMPDPNTGGGGPKPVTGGGDGGPTQVTGGGDGGPKPVTGSGGDNPNTTNDVIPLGAGGSTPQDEVEAIKAEEAKGNRDNESSVLTGNSQGNQQNLEEIARKAAEDAASKLNNNQQGADSVESDPARGQLQEGEIYAKNGELKADLNRDPKGNLVQTIYKAGSNGESKQPAMIVTEDKSGNREWMRFGDNGQVVEQGNSVVETGKLGKFVAMERTIRDNVETVKYFYPNGNLKTEIQRGVNKDGSIGDTLKFRQFNEDGKMTVNTGEHGMDKQNRAYGKASADAKVQGQPQQDATASTQGQQAGQPTATTSQSSQPAPQAQQPKEQPAPQTGQPTATTSQSSQPAPQGASVPLPKENLENIAKLLAKNPFDKDGKKITDTKDANGNAIKVSYGKDDKVNSVTRTSNINGVKSEEFVKLDAKKNVVESGKTIDYKQGENRAIKIEKVVKDGIATIKMSQYDPKVGLSSMKPMAELTGRIGSNGEFYSNAKLKTFDDKGNLVNNKKVDAKAAEAKIMASVPQAKPTDDKANGKPQTQQQKEQEKAAQKADDKPKGQQTATSPQTGQPTPQAQQPKGQPALQAQQTGQPTQPAPQGASVPLPKENLENIAKLLAKNPLDKDGKKIAGMKDANGNAIKVSYGKDDKVNSVTRTSNINGVKSEEFVKLDAKKNVVESGKTIDYKQGENRAIKIEKVVKDGIATIKMSQYDPKVGLSSMKPMAELTGRIGSNGEFYGNAKLKTYKDDGSLINNKKVNGAAAEAKIMASVPQAKPTDDKAKGQPQHPEKDFSFEISIDKDGNGEFVVVDKLTQKIKERTPYKHNKKNGTRIEYYDLHDNSNGRIETPFVDDKIHGTVLHYKDGIVFREENFVNNKREGITRDYKIVDGKQVLWMETPYKDGVKHGVSVVYADDGKTIKKKIMWKDGFKDGKIEEDVDKDPDKGSSKPVTQSKQAPQPQVQKFDNFAPLGKDSIETVAKQAASAGIYDKKQISVTTADDQNNLVKMYYDGVANTTNVSREIRNADGSTYIETAMLDDKNNVVGIQTINKHKRGDNNYLTVVETDKDGVKSYQFYHSERMNSLNPHLDAEVTVVPGKQAEVKKYDDKGELISTESGVKHYDAYLSASKHQQEMSDNNANEIRAAAQAKVEASGGRDNADAVPNEQHDKKTESQSSHAQQSAQQAGDESAQPAPVEAPKPKPVEVDRLREGVVRDDEGHMLSETVKHADGDTNKTTRVLYSPEGKIYNIAEEDEKGNREWYSFGSEGNISSKPTEHGTRTLNDDGSVDYTLYDDNNKIISKTVENTDGSSVQSFYNDDGEAYAKVEKDANGRVTCSMIGDEESSQTTLKPEEGASGDSLKAENGADGELKAEAGSKIGDKFNITFDFGDKKDNGNEHDAAVRQRELETLVRDLKRTISGLGNNSESGSSLSGLALDALMGELKRRGVKVGG